MVGWHPELNIAYFHTFLGETKCRAEGRGQRAEEFEANVFGIEGQIIML